MPYTPITGGGSFTAGNIAALNNNFSLIPPVVDLWVRPQYALPGATGTYAKPFASVTAACSSSLLKPGMTIGLLGVTTEELTAPIINDISIVGMGNQPRQATTSGAPNGGGATWLSPSGGTGTLLKVTGQAWKLQNIYFNNSATGATTSCVHIDCVGDPPAEADASHTQVLGCIFTGGNFGIYAPLGPNYVTIDGCTFYNFASGSDTAIKAAQSVRTLLGWKINGCTFYNNVNHVVAPLSRGYVTGNNFNVVGNTITTTIALSLTGGAGNTVSWNSFNRPLNTSPNATLYVGGTGDVWGANVGADDFFFGVPDNA